MAFWTEQQLNENYVELTREMRSWLADYSSKSLQDAARESFIIGDKVLHNIAYDPRLPGEMINSASRGNMVETMIQFNTVGRAIWLELIDRVVNDSPLDWLRAAYWCNV